MSDKVKKHTLCGSMLFLLFEVIEIKGNNRSPLTATLLHRNIVLRHDEVKPSLAKSAIDNEDILTELLVVQDSASSGDILRKCCAYCDSQP